MEWSILIVWLIFFEKTCVLKFNIHPHGPLVGDTRKILDCLGCSPVAVGRAEAETSLKAWPMDVPGHTNRARRHRMPLVAVPGPTTAASPYTWVGRGPF